MTQDALLMPIRALVVTKLDICRSASTGVSGSLMQRLQSVLNAAAGGVSRPAYWAPASLIRPTPKKTPVA